MISVLILTLNEEANIADCIRSVSWSDDIVVLDSGSTDNTVNIARELGARTYYRKWDNEKAQREYSLTQIRFRYPWVYNPDADERPESDLIRQMIEKARDRGTTQAGFRVRFKTMFMGKWIKRSSLYPTWVLRLYRPDKVRIDREINLSFSLDGEEGKLDGHFLHYSFNKGLEDWFAKHNRYSTAEATESLKSILDGRLDIGGLFSFSDPVRRRRAMKELSFRLPMRPTLRFLYMYALRGGFLDGSPGYHYCRMISYYEYMIVLKMKEQRRREKGLPI